MTTPPSKSPEAVSKLGHKMKEMNKSQSLASKPNKKSDHALSPAKASFEIENGAESVTRVN